MLSEGLCPVLWGRRGLSSYWYFQKTQVWPVGASAPNPGQSKAKEIVKVAASCSTAHIYPTACNLEPQQASFYVIAWTLF